VPYRSFAINCCLEREVGRKGKGALSEKPPEHETIVRAVKKKKDLNPRRKALGKMYHKSIFSH